MRLIRHLILSVCLLGILCACAPKDLPEASVPPVQPTPTSAPSPTPTPAAPSDWIGKDTGLSAEELIDYFVEVALYTEYDEDGTSATRALSKWRQPIFYYLTGDYTAEDKEILDRLVNELNQISGFPDLCPINNPSAANMTISFLSRAEMDARLMSQYGSCNGFATFQWYNDTHELFSAEILYCTDMDSSIRSSVICEELLQALGLGNDSGKYPDSVFYQYGDQASWPSPLDWTMVQLLYNRQLFLGMNENEVRQTLTSVLSPHTN